MSGIVFPVKIDAKITSALQAAQKKIADIKLKVDSINKAKLNPKFAEGISKLKENFSGLKDKLTDGVKEIPVFGEALSGILSKLGPTGLAIAAVGTALFAATNHFIHLAEEFGKVNKLFKEFETNGNKVDKLTAKAKALKETFGYTEEELAAAAKSISKTFGIDSVQAMEKLSQASIIAGKKLPLEDITEFGTQIKSIGGNVDSLLGNMSISTKNGMFSNKSLDMMKEFGNRIRENNQATQDLLKSTGNQQVSKDLAKGLITQEQAFKKVFSNLDKLSTSQQQTLISGMLGGAGEDLGKAGIESIAKFKGGLDDLIDKNNEVVKENQKRLALEEELAEAQGKSAKAFIPILKLWEQLKLKGQIFIEKILTPISELFGDVWNLIKEVYKVFSDMNHIVMPIKFVIGVFVVQFKVWFALMKGVLTILTNIFKGFQKLKDFLINVFFKVFEKLGDVFDKIFGEGAFKKVQDFFIKIKDMIVNVFKGLGDFFSGLWEAMNQGLQGNFDAAKNAWKKASDTITPGSTPGEKEVNKTVDTNLNKTVADNVENSVKGATSEVKNITLNLEALQKIGTQNIHNNKDVGNISALLQRELLQMANDVNQTGNN